MILLALHAGIKLNFVPPRDLNTEHAPSRLELPGTLGSHIRDSTDSYCCATAPANPPIALLSGISDFFTRGTDQIDHDLDHLYPNLPLGLVVQDLYSTHSTLETRPRPCRSYSSHAAT